MEQPFTPRRSPVYDMEISVENIRTVFCGADDLVERPVRAGGQLLTVFFIDGLVSGSEISDFVIRSFVRNMPARGDIFRSALEGLVCNAVAQEVENMDDLAQRLVSGFCVVIFPGQTRAIAYEVKTGDRRSPSPPEVENTVKGAKDAFTETIRTNTSLIRRHLRSPRLRIHETVVGRKSLTTVAVLWISELTNAEMVQKMRERIDAIDVDGFISPAAVEEYLSDSQHTAFPLLQYTERTDRFGEGLLAGQVGVLVDGLPLGYLAPSCLERAMTSVEDRGTNYIVASFVRVFRYGALLVSLLLPALYIAMAQFHQAMIPTKLLEAIIRSKQFVPFPTILEVLALLVSFEILQESGLHLPQSIGHTVSIIGGLVVGTAAVEASLISPSALIVVSVAGICGFAIPGQDLSAAIRVWRFVLAICASISGLFLLTAGLIVMLLHLGALESFGQPYLAPFSDATTGGVIPRRRLVDDKFRDPALHPRDVRNQR